MKKVATILANGFEEIEALTIVDVLRRAGIDCDLIGMEETVTGSHQITVEVDRLWNGDLSDYDGIFLPGGMPGAANLRDNAELITALQEESGKGKTISAICAAPIVLARAGLLKDKHYTCYDGFEEEIQDGHYQKETVVKDGNLLDQSWSFNCACLGLCLGRAIWRRCPKPSSRNALSRRLWRCLKELFWTPYFLVKVYISMTGNDFSMI